MHKCKCNVSIGCSPKWRYADTERQRGDKLLNKCHYFYFLCLQKVFSSVHKIEIEPLMADDDVFHTLQSTGQSQASGFHPKYLKLLQFLSEYVLVLAFSLGSLNEGGRIFSPLLPVTSPALLLVSSTVYCVL